MVGTLHAQAEMIWPLEQAVLKRIGLFDAPRIADLGCGTGQFACRLADAAPASEIVGLDLFEGHVVLAKRDAARPNVTYLVGDAQASQFEDASFDAVTVRHFLHALPEPEAVLIEARRILRPGGLMYLLAEDYQTLLFDAVVPGASSLFNEAQPGVLKAGTDLHHGRTAYRALRGAGFEDIVVDGLLVDTTNTDRETFARMLRFWRDGYETFLAEALGAPVEAVRMRFDAQIETVLDADRYACWLLFGISAHRPG